MSDQPVTLPVLQVILEDIRASQTRVENTLAVAVEKIEHNIESRHASLNARMSDFDRRLSVLEIDKVLLKGGWKLLLAVASVIVFLLGLGWTILTNWDAALRARQAFSTPEVVVIPEQRLP